MKFLLVHHLPRLIGLERSTAVVDRQCEILYIGYVEMALSRVGLPNKIAVRRPSLRRPTRNIEVNVHTFIPKMIKSNHNDITTEIPNDNLYFIFLFARRHYGSIFSQLYFHYFAFSNSSHFFSKSLPSGRD